MELEEAIINKPDPEKYGLLSHVGRRKKRNKYKIKTSPLHTPPFFSSLFSKPGLALNIWSWNLNPGITEVHHHAQLQNQISLAVSLAGPVLYCWASGFQFVSKAGVFFLPLCLLRVRSGTSPVPPAHVQACLPSVGSIKQILNSKLVSFIEDHRESAEQSTKWHLTLRSYGVKHELNYQLFLYSG